MINGSFEEVFDSTFPKSEKSVGDRLTDRITVPIPEAYKRKYERIQSATGQEFIDTVRALIIAAIDKAEKRIA
jgi:hypothetical protein